MTAQPAASPPMPADPGYRRPSVLARIASGVAGVAILGSSALFTLGTSLAAPLGVAVMRRAARRRNRPFTWSSSWLAAIVASSAVIVCALAVMAARSPDAVLQRFHEAAVARHNAPAAQPPAWLTRAFPQAAQRPDPITERVVNSRAFTLYFGMVGVGLVILIFGTIAGSAGWAGTMLLTHAFSRRPAG